MADADGQILIAVDGDTKPLEDKLGSIKNKVQSTVKDMPPAKLDVDLDTDGLKQQLSTAQSMVSSGMNDLAAVGKVAGAGIAAVGAGVAAFTADALQTAAAFEAQMSTVGAIANATAQDMARLREKAIDMGAKTAFSATESGKAFEYMAMAGWDTEEMLAGIDGVMSLAAASGEDLGLVADIVTDSMTAFGLKANESARFADVLAAAATSSNTNVSKMGLTFQYVGSLAGALKYSVEDVAVAVGILANNGIKGEKAGTALRGILSNLAKPTKSVSDGLDMLGISTSEFDSALTNADGTVKPFAEVLALLRERFSGLTDAQKTTAAAYIAGQEGMSGLLALVNTTDEEYQSLTASMEASAGAAEKMAAVRLDNLAGDLEEMSGAAETMKIRFTENIDGAMRESVQTITKGINRIADEMSNNDNLKKAAESAAELFSGFADWAVEELVELIPKVTKTLDWFTRHGDTVAEIVVDIGKGFLLFKGASGVIKIISGISGSLKVLNGIQAAGRLADAAKAAGDLTAAAKSADGLKDLVSGLSTSQVVAGRLTGKLGEASTQAALLGTTAGTAATAFTAAFAVVAVAAIGAMIYKASQGDKELRTLAETAEKSKKSWDAMLDSSAKDNASSQRELDRVQALAEELDGLVDANGRVQEANRGRVQYILDQLNPTLGTEITMVDGVIDKYQEQLGTLDDLIAKKRVMAQITSIEDDVAAFDENKPTLVKRLAESTAQLAQAQERLAVAQALVAAGGSSIPLAQAMQDVQNLNTVISQTEEELNSGFQVAEAYNTSLEAVTYGNTAAAQAALDGLSFFNAYMKDTQDKSLQDQIAYMQGLADMFGETADKYKGTNDAMAAAMMEARKLALEELEKLNADGMTALITAVESRDADAVRAVSGLTMAMIGQLESGADQMFIESEVLGGNVPEGMKTPANTGRMVQAADTLVDSAVTTVQSRSGDLHATGEDAGTQVADGMGSAANAAQAAGGSVMDGFFAGLKSKYDAIVQCAKGIADAVTGALSSAFEINSPSKLIAREVGAPIAEGLVYGMDAGEQDVADAAQRYRQYFMEQFTPAQLDAFSDQIRAVNPYEAVAPVPSVREIYGTSQPSGGDVHLGGIVVQWQGGGSDVDVDRLARRLGQKVSSEIRSRGGTL